MKSISQRLRASKESNDKAARKATVEAMNASITPAKYQPKNEPEASQDDDTQCALGRPCASASFEATRRYIEQEIAAGLTVVRCPAPSNNMGVTEEAQPVGLSSNGREICDFDGTELVAIKPKGKSGKYTLVRVPGQLEGIDSRVGFVDQVSFTLYTSAVLKRETFFPYDPIKGQWPEIDAVSRVSSAMVEIFGFGVTAQLDKGRNFYTHSYSLGDYAEYGAVSCGGNNNKGTSADTINVQITGQGCLMASSGWQTRLFHYLDATSGHLSRIDIAADLYNGQYTPEQAKSEYDQGLYSLTNRKPNIQLHGSSWWNEQSDTGKTIAIGTREGGKLTRIYEKGKEQLGKIASGMVDENHPLLHLKSWVRIETEWHRTNRVLPLEMLLEPGKYLAGAHPAALGWLSDVQEKIEIIKRKAVATVERAQQVLVRQFGASIKALQDIGKWVEVQEKIDKISKVPRWANGFDQPDPNDPKWVTFERELATLPF
jgi:phage replication initiation protein